MKINKSSPLRSLEPDYSGACSIFNQAYSAFVSNESKIRLFREVGKLGLSAAIPKFEEDQRLLALAHHMQFGEDGTPSPHPEIEALAAQTLCHLTNEKAKSFEGIFDSAALVLAHTALDTFIVELNVAAAFANPKSWLREFDKDQISYADFRSGKWKEALLLKLQKLLNRLSREGLLKNCSRLHRLCGPLSPPPTIANYVFDERRLKHLDDMRHGVIHDSAFGLPEEDIDKAVEYMLSTAIYFCTMVHRSFYLMVNSSNELSFVFKTLTRVTNRVTTSPSKPLNISAQTTVAEVIRHFLPNDPSSDS